MIEECRVRTPARERGNLLNEMRNKGGENPNTSVNTKKPAETENKPDSITITIIGAKRGNGTKRVPVDKK